MPLYFGDEQFEFLCRVIRLVDGDLDKLDQRATEVHDPDAMGVYDAINYIAGFGFTALQTYLTYISAGRGVSKRSALDDGPVHVWSGLPMAALINAVANHWKHSPEWSSESPGGHASQTLAAFTALGVDAWGEYPLAKALCEIVTPHPARFGSLLPFVQRWREAVGKSR